MLDPGFAPEQKVRLEVGTPQRNLLLSQIFTAIFISIVNSVANWYTRFEKSGIFFGYLVGKVLVW